MKYWRFGHLNKVYVKTGDKVRKGELIALMGKTGNSPTSHLHLDCLTYRPSRWTEYVIGKTKQWVLDRYEDPRIYVSKTLPTAYHHLGYGWLSPAYYGGRFAWHSGLDINGKGAGNTDWKQKIYAHVDGVVEFIYDGSGYNGGWGKMIILKQTQMKTYRIKSELRNVLKELDKRFDHEKPKDHKKMAKKLEDLFEIHADTLESYNTLSENYSKSLGLINRLRMEIAGLSQIIKQRNQTIARAKEVNEGLEDEIKKLKALNELSAKNVKVVEALRFLYKTIIS